MSRNRDGSVRKPTYAETLKHYPETYAMMSMVCNESYYPMEFFNDFPKSNKVVDLYAIGVCKNYRRQGIAKRLVMDSVKAARKSGCDGAVITASNPVSNNIASFLNMTLYKSIQWSDFKNDTTGEEWFPAENLPECQTIHSYYKFF